MVFSVYLSSTGMSIMAMAPDVHHGNGTQAIFEEEERVLYFSVHSTALYPRTGQMEDVGEGKGRGYSVNVPFKSTGLRDDDYLMVFSEILLPIVEDFKPEFILISAGFDAAVDDPLGQCFVTPQGFAAMLQQLLQFADGRVVLALEGGYNIDSLVKCVCSCLETLLNNSKASVQIPNPNPSQIILERIFEIQDYLCEEFSDTWKKLCEKRKERIEQPACQLSTIKWGLTKKRCGHQIPKRKPNGRVFKVAKGAKLAKSAKSSPVKSSQTFVEYFDFCPYIKKLGKQVNPDLSISKHGVIVMNFFLNDMCGRIMEEARNLIHKKPGIRSTLLVIDLKYATKLTIPCNLAVHCVSSGCKALETLKIPRK